MCFTWTFSVGKGPLWLVGDTLYDRHFNHMFESARGPMQVRVRDPVKRTTEVRTVKMQDVHYGKTAIADPFPIFPPAPFTWSHYAMLYDLVHPELCEEVARYWARKELSDESVREWGPFYAEWHIVFLWSYDDRTIRSKHMRVHERLQEGAKELTTSMKEVRDVPTTMGELIRFVSSKLECIWMKFVEDQRKTGEECMKHLCSKCRTKFMDKLLSCRQCGIRYCSPSCQSEDLHVHKLDCRRPSINEEDL